MTHQGMQRKQSGQKTGSAEYKLTEKGRYGYIQVTVMTWDIIMS